MNLYQDLVLAHDADFEAICSRFDSGVVIYSRDASSAPYGFRILGINPTALDMAGIASANTVIGRDIGEVFPAVGETGLLDGLSRVLSTGNASTIPPIRYADANREGWYRNSLYRLTDDLIMVVFTDITQQVQSFEHLQASEHRLELLATALADGIFDWDVVTNEVYFSPAYKAQIGYEDHELVNEFATWRNNLHPDDRQRCLDELAEFRNSNERVWDLEFRYRHKGGHYKWIRARATAVRHPETRTLIRLLGVHIDIDEQKRAQLDSARSRDIAETVLGTLPDLVFLLDSDGTIIEYHAADDAELFRPPEEFLGRQVDDVLPPELASLHHDAVSRAMFSGELVAFEYDLPITDSVRRFEARLRVSPDSRRIAVIVRDITDEHAADLALGARVRELSALYHIFRLARSEKDLTDFARKIARYLLAGMADPEGGECVITIDNASFISGGEYQGKRDATRAAHFGAPVFDGRKHRGRIEVWLRPGARTDVNDQQIVNTAAQAMSIWLRAGRAQHEVGKYLHIIDSISDRVALVGRDLNVEIVNRAFAAALGEEDEKSLAGRSAVALLGARYGSDFAQRLAATLKGSVQRFQRQDTTAGADRLLSVSLTPYVETDIVTGAVISEHDLTDLHDAQRGLRQAAKVFESAAEGILMTELDGTISNVNDTFSSITGVAREQAIGHNATILSSVRHDREFFVSMYEHLFSEGSWRGELWLTRPDGDIFPVRMTVGVVYEDDQPSGYVGVFSDISSEKTYQSRLEHQANHDSLTGLPNRAFLDRVLERTIEAAERTGDPFTLLYIDLDHFKEINDTLGHDAGDQLLRDAVQRMSGSLRASDTLARVGGDEFIAVLPGAPRDSNGLLVAEKLLQELSRSFAVQGTQASISASIGVAGFPEDGRNAALLLSNADAAMYLAKREGRAGWRFVQTE